MLETWYDVWSLRLLWISFPLVVLSIAFAMIRKDTWLGITWLIIVALWLASFGLLWLQYFLKIQIGFQT